MIHNQRILFSDDGSLTDLSINLNDFRSNSSTLPIVATEDYLYIGSDLPFNHRYFDIDTANDESSITSVQIWFGNTWLDAVDILDRTSVSGATLAQDGIIQWSTNRLKSWDKELDSDSVTGLDNTVIYNFYWLRLKFSADLKATTAINYIGHKFSDDDDLYSFYPDLNNSNLKTAFEAGKTTWKEQHLVASECLIRDLKRKGIVISSSQILDFELFIQPSIHKTASIIYGAFGKPYAEQKLIAIQEYDKLMDIKRFNADLNQDGNLSDYEKQFSTGFLTR